LTTNYILEKILKVKSLKRELREKAAAEEKARIEKEKAEAERFKREWNSRWETKNNDDFKKFYNEEFPTEVKIQYNGYIYISDMEKIKKKWEFNPDLWVRYDKWLKKKREEEQEQARMSKELDDIWHSIIRDFYTNPYRDKITTNTKNGISGIVYKFEDGTIFEMYGNQIHYKNTIYTVGLKYKSKFVTLINKMIDDRRERPRGSGYKSSSSSSSGSGYRSSSSGSSSSSNRGTKANKWSNHPKGALYQTLKDTITQREAQLKKMSKNDENRVHLENELATAKRKLEAMRDKYKFENFNYLNSFNLYNESIPSFRYDINIEYGDVDFGISYGELEEILFEITDEFSELEFAVENSYQSTILDISTNPSLTHKDMKSADRDSFIITFYDKTSEWPSQLKVLHYVEPKIFNLISHVNDKLSQYGLEVYFNDFGENDAYYELLITKKGNKPALNKQRYIVDDNGEIHYKEH